MKSVHGSASRAWVCLCVLLALLMVAAWGAAQEGQVVRVAFPQVAGFTTTDEYGERHGLVVDYLNEIAKYTGWTYEYIDLENDDILTSFYDGAFDLMGGTYYSEAMTDIFAYPKYSCGSAKSVLLSNWEDETIHGYELGELNGKTIGVYDRATESIRRLEQFLTMNNLNCTIKRYTWDQLEGRFYSYLENGEIDLLLGNASDNTGRFRAAAYIDAQPHYIVTSAENTELLEEFNWALEQVLSSNPDFADRCYERNFTQTYMSVIVLSAAEREYISRKGSVKVAVPQEYHPLYCVTRHDGDHDGMAVDILRQIQNKTGLEFEYVIVQSYREAYEKVVAGEADMAGFFLGTDAQALDMGLACTDAYGTLNDLVVRNKSVTYPGKNLKACVVQGRTLPAYIQAEQVIYCADAHEALNLVNRGAADFFYGLSAQIESEMQEFTFANCVPVSLYENRNDIGFALKRPVDPTLMSIVNKALNGISEKQKLAIADANLIAMGMGTRSIMQIINANPVLALCVVCVLLLLLLAVVAAVAFSRVRAARMRAELARAEAESRAKSEFLSRMSHEIRTPMNAIVGLADIMDLQRDVPQSVRVNIGKLRSSSRYLISLINDILDMSRIDSGMLTIVSEPFSLNQVLDEMNSMMSEEARRRGLALHIDVQVTHEQFVGDAVRLRQVLTNLLSNAFKFTPADGHVSLTVKEVQACDGAATIEFTVEDTGIGIRPEDQQRIFNAFEQAGKSSTRVNGTGLGLPISRNIVRLMGGELKLQSQPDKGSRFSFELTMPLSDQVPEITNSVCGEGDFLAGVRFLMAEDNALNAEIACELLKMQGAQVDVAENGKIALEMFTLHVPHTYAAILMDIQMPEMDGLTAARAIRQSGQADAATVPIIAMTANSFKEDRDAAKAAGMDEFVPKPLDVQYLYRVLRGLAPNGHSHT